MFSISDMDLDDIFDGSHHKRKKYKSDYHHNSEYESNHRHNYKDEYKNMLFSRLKSNPRLMILAAIVLLILLALVVVIVIVLVPYILQLAGFASDNGLKGIIDKIWNGAK